MNTRRDKDQAPDDEAFGDLLRSAGRGPGLSAEARVRIRSNVEAVWRESLRDTGQTSRASSPVDRPRPGAVAMPRARHRRRRRRWLAPAMAATVAVVVSLVLLDRPDNVSPTAAPSFARVNALQGDVRVVRDDRDVTVGEDVLVGDRINTGGNGGIALKLSTGEELRLNADTIVEVTAGNAISLIAGMVYFDAPPDMSQADFFVQTALGTVAHVGTQYAASIDGDELIVSVREGAALVRDGDRELTAAVGERLRIEDTGNVERSNFAIDHPDWAWVEGLARADFGGPGSVMSLLQWAARQSGRQLQVDSDEVRIRAESVLLNQVDGLTPPEIISVVQSTTEFVLSESATTLDVSLR